MTADVLLEWLAEPDPGRGVRFLGADGSWSFHPYPELAAAALDVAGRLRSAGVRPGEPVALVLGSGPEFIAAFFGALAAGAVPAPLAPPATLQDRGAYRDRASAQLAVLRPALVLCGAAWAQRLREARPAGAGVPVVEPTADWPAVGVGRGAGLGPGPGGERGAHRRALIQFTSGSSGAPRAVAVSAQALAANIDAIRRWLRMGPDDPTASWLPFHHDMGLVGCLLTPVTTGSDLWVLRPEDFVRSPLTWLRCFGAQGARLTATPSFGLAQVVRRVRPAALAGLDFGGWRAVITGAERIDPAVLAQFVDLLAPHGFRSRSLLPAYGLAEATLAVTGLPLRAEPRTLRLDRDSLRPGRPVRPADSATPADRVLALVGCGEPLLADGRVRILDERGRSLPAGTVGEIACAGAATADGYLGEGRREFGGGELRTGDCGFLHQGQLYVLGRLGDSLKLRGRAVFAEDLEAALGEIGALRHRQRAVLLGALDGADTAVAVVEGRDGPWVAATVDLLRRRLEGAAVVVLAGPPGLVLRTSSGKPRRRPMWTAFAAGTLGGQVLAERGADGAGQGADGAGRGADGAGRA